MKSSFHAFVARLWWPKLVRGEAFLFDSFCIWYLHFFIDTRRSFTRIAFFDLYVNQCAFGHGLGPRLLPTYREKKNRCSTKRQSALDPVYQSIWISLLFRQWLSGVRHSLASLKRLPYVDVCPQSLSLNEVFCLMAFPFLPSHFAVLILWHCVQHGSRQPTASTDETLSTKGCLLNSDLWTYFFPISFWLSPLRTVQISIHFPREMPFKENWKRIACETRYFPLWRADTPGREEEKGNVFEKGMRILGVYEQEYICSDVFYFLWEKVILVVYRSLSEVWKHMQRTSVPLGKDVPTNSVGAPEQCKNTWRFIQWRMALHLQNFICYPSHNHCVATTQPFARQGKDRNQQSKRGNGTEAPAEPPRDV